MKKLRFLKIINALLFARCFCVEAVVEEDLLYKKSKYFNVRPFDSSFLGELGTVSLPDHLVKRMRFLDDMRNEQLLDNTESTLEIQVPALTFFRVCRLLCLVESRNFDFVNEELASLSEDEAVEFVKAVDYLNVPLLAERYGQATSYGPMFSKIKELLPRLASGDEIINIKRKHRSLIRLLVDMREPFEEINRAMQEPLEESRILVAARKDRYRQKFQDKGQNVDELMVNAAHQNNVDDLNFYLFAGANPKYETILGTTALIWAAKSKAIEPAIALLEANADPNARSIFGDTALHASASRGACSIVKKLLNKKADPNLVGALGESPLAAAIKNKHKEVVRDLIAYGAME